MVKVKRERLGGDSEFKMPVDRISNLPSILLGLILSFLTTKEAAATSILSRRWRCFWTLSPTLDLDGTEFMERAKFTERVKKSSSLKKERSEYVKWVDRVIGSCSTVESLVKFRLFFDLTNEHATHINRWLHFAVSKKVESLELNLTDRGSPQLRRDHECYKFSYGNFPDGFKMMKKLFTHNVNVSGEALEHFLGNCPHLEHLNVSGSNLTALKIIRTSPRFKCLEICLCNHLDSLVIRDSHLVTFKYGGKKMSTFELVNVPLLTQLWIRGRLSLNMQYVVDMFSPLLPHLHLLNIYFVCDPSWEETTPFLSSDARLTNLKQLEVSISSAKAVSTLLPLVNLISSSHSLQRFVVEVRTVTSGSNFLRRGCGTNKFQLYPHLKEVEFAGYGCMFHELIMHFVENDAALENVVVDPRSCKISLDHPWERIFKPRGDEKLVRAYAEEKLRKCIPPRINVKFL